MKLFVLGATGHTGTHIDDIALSHSHNVTAFVRSPQKIMLRDQRLRVVAGNPLDVDQLAKEMAGHDAVLSALGVRPPQAFRPHSVVGEGAADRGEVRGRHARRRGPGRGCGRRARVIDDRAEDREGAVAIVEELQQPRLLGPVGLGGDPDAPEAVAVAARVGRHVVDVAVAGDPGDRVGEAVQERSHGEAIEHEGRGSRSPQAPGVADPRPPGRVPSC